MSNTNARIADMYFEPEHYNRNCGCTIPAAWCATVEVRNRRGAFEPIPKVMEARPCDIVERLKSEFGTVSAPAYVHSLVKFNSLDG